MMSSAATFTKEQVLKHTFGYDHFRPLQAEIIDTVLAGRDCLVLMPTGGGKSVCFQVPALVKDGLAVVISPLIALMKDQVEALRANGVRASFLNSTLSPREQDAVLWAAKLGELKLLYVAPERLFSGGTVDFLKKLNVSLFAIDESHCISAWGHDFRPEYRQLSVLKQEFPSVPVIALTATADKVTRKDILGQLGIPEAPTFIASFDRPNLSLTVLPGRKRLERMVDFLEKHPRQPGIVYCLSRKSTEEVAEKLRKEGFRAQHYHAGCAPEERSRVQEAFLKDDIQIIVATIAFGMGIDKSNVRWILHYNLPSNVESFYQEIGRAGRDGEPADTVLFYSYQDVAMRQDMIENSELPEAQKELQRAKLARMKQYAEADICRRRILLSYFNETVERDCGNCDVCKNPRQRFEGRVLAQKALSGVARTGERVAMGALIDILRGSRNQNVLRHGYDQLPTFGVGRDLKSEEWADYLSQLLNSGVVDIAYDEGHAFKLNPVSRLVLKGEREVPLVKFIPFEERQAARDAAEPKERGKKEVIKDAMFERLRALRKAIADTQGVPPYVIFSDATLSEMAQKRPISEFQMKQISGVGEEKFRRFGEAFINEILGFARETAQVQPSGRVVKGFTYIQTLDLYKQGLSLEEMARQRSLSTSTIVAHLVKVREEGHEVDLWQFIERPAYTVIVGGAREIGLKRGDAIAPLFELLEQKYDYALIRLALALWELEEGVG